MSRSTTEISAPAPVSGGTKALWGAIGLLGVAVLALGGMLLRQPAAPDPSKVAVVPNIVLEAPAAGTQAGAQPATPNVNTEMKEPAASSKAPTHAHKVAKASHSDSSATGVSHAPGSVTAQGGAATPAPPPCANCGTVSAVTPVQHDGAGTGTGAVAGGVIGGLLGNQVGRGDGKTLATVLGAVGGGFAGNAVEKKMKKVTVYEVQIRMDDGTVRNLEQASSASVGSRVIVEGNTLRSMNPNTAMAPQR